MGHPAVGTACLLAELDAGGKDEFQVYRLILEEGGGNVSCEVNRNSGNPTSAVFDLTRLPVPHTRMSRERMCGNRDSLIRSFRRKMHHAVEQGFEIGRTSLITLELTVTCGVLSSARIGGSAVRVTKGMLEV